MVHLLTVLAQNPIRALCFAYSFFISTFLAIAESTLLPHYPVYQPLRTRIARAYFAAAAIHLSRLVHRLPVTNCPSKRARHVGDAQWKGYVIPGVKKIGEPAQGELVSCVIVYAHGGGYAVGEARQYLNYMERWIDIARADGIDLTFLSVEYPLSDKAAHPAQRDSFLKAYKYLLQCGVAPSTVLFMGDSAGAAISIMAAIRLPQLNMPQPAGSILISPWLDTSLKSYEGGNPTVATDYVNTANTSVPMMFKKFLGGIDGKDPEVNPLYLQPEAIRAVSLNPQLILSGGAEMAREDGRQWALLCDQAQVPSKLVLEWGQLHIYALGSRWVPLEVRTRTDRTIVAWIQECLGEARDARR